MRSLLFILLFFPLFLFAQDDPQTGRLPAGIQDTITGTALILKDYTIIFEKIYSSDLKKEELAAKIRMYLPTVKNFHLTGSENQSAYQLSGRLNHFVVNCNYLNGKYYDPAKLINRGIDANVLISIKDKKYRVIISEMTFRDYIPDYKYPGVDSPLNEYLTFKYKTRFELSKEEKRIAKYISDDLLYSFDINNHNKIAVDF
ncbi:hypothetical protein H7F33_13460 [Pedobacter sp. PAMC26386]|nr:hypothetical protein H7F33_13460 [Pedobacter sp. PAMC26386]